MRRIAVRLELVLDGRDAGHGCHTLYQLIDLGREHWPRQRDSAGGRDDVNRPWMRHEPPHPGTYALHEHIVGRRFLLDQPIERAGRGTTQTMAHIARGQPGDGLRAVRDVRRRFAQTRSTAAAAARIHQVHRCSA
jgi:hypothetical protein